MITMLTCLVKGTHVVGVITKVTRYVFGQYVVGWDYHGNTLGYWGVFRRV